MAYDRGKIFCSGALALWLLLTAYRLSVAISKESSPELKAAATKGTLMALGGSAFWAAHLFIPQRMPPKELTLLALMVLTQLVDRMDRIEASQMRKPGM